MLRIKAAAYKAWAAGEGEQAVNPVLFVVCQTVEDAKETADMLAADDMLGDSAAVLEITSQSSDEALAMLAKVEEAELASSGGRERRQAKGRLGRQEHRRHHRAAQTCLAVA